MASLSAILGVGIKNVGGPGAASFGRDADKVKTKAAQAAAATKALAGSMRQMSGAAAAASSSMLGMFGVFGSLALIATTTNTIAQFNDTMAIAGKVSRATGETFVAMTEQAKMLGATTRFTAEQAAQGLLFLGRAGFEAEEAMKALPSTLDLAAAGVLGLGEAADMASNILKQFQMDTSETVRVVDALVIVSNRSNTSVAQLGEAMKYAGPVANAVGLSVEQTAAAIGVLGDAGIQASLAGTALRGAFAAILGVTPKAEKALKEMGITKDQLNIQAEGLVTTFEKLAAGNLTAERAVKIFGRRQAAAALVMADSTVRMRELELATVVAAGEAEAMSQVMAGTLRGSLLATKSAFEGLLLATGDRGLTGALQNTLDTITGSLRIFAGMSHQVEKNRTAAILLSGALTFITTRFIAIRALGMIAFFGSLAKSMVVATAKAGVLRAALTVLGGPIGLLSLAIGGAAVAIQELTRRSSEFESQIEDSAKAADRFEDTLRSVSMQTDVVQRITSINRGLGDLIESYTLAAAAQARFAGEQELVETPMGFDRITGERQTQFVSVPSQASRQAEDSLRRARGNIEATMAIINRDVVTAANAISLLGVELQKADAAFEAAVGERSKTQAAMSSLQAKSNALIESLKLGQLISQVTSQLESLRVGLDPTSEMAGKLDTEIGRLKQTFIDAIPPELLQGIGDFDTAMGILTKTANETNQSLSETRQTLKDLDGEKGPFDLIQAVLKSELETMGETNQERKIRRTLEAASKDANVELHQLTEAQLKTLRELVAERVKEVETAERLKKVNDDLNKTIPDLEKQIDIAKLRAQGLDEQADAEALVHSLIMKHGADQIKMDDERILKIIELRKELSRIMDTAKPKRKGKTVEDQIKDIAADFASEIAMQVREQAAEQAGLQASLDALAAGATPEAAVQAGEDVLRIEENRLEVMKAMVDFQEKLTAQDPTRVMTSEEKSMIEDRIEALQRERQAVIDLQRALDDQVASAEKRIEATDEMKEMAALLTRENEKLILSNGRLRDVNLELSNAEKLEMLVKQAKIGASEAELESLAELEAKLKQLIETNAQLKQTSDAMEIFENISLRVENAITNMFMSIITGAEEAEDAFKRLALSISEMVLQQIIAQQIVAPIVGAIGGAINPGAGAGAAATPAQSRLGNVFDNGMMMQRYAYGGIVNRPVEFPMSDGRRGLMGEAGPEAILPLQRDSGGRLGVIAASGGGEQKTVNVNMVVNTPDADSFRRSRTQILNRIRSGSRGV